MDSGANIGFIIRNGFGWFHSNNFEAAKLADVHAPLMVIQIPALHPADPPPIQLAWWCQQLAQQVHTSLGKQN